jgi:hypothetical protein
MTQATYHTLKYLYLHTYYNECGLGYNTEPSFDSMSYILLYPTFYESVACDSYLRQLPQEHLQIHHVLGFLFCGL